MIPCKCVAKERDKNKNIVGYILADAYGNMCRIPSQDLKQYIIDKKLQVINLKLTSDNRLIDEKIKDIDNSQSCNLVNPTEFVSSTTKVKPLYGKMSNNDKLYTEFFVIIGDGILKVSKSDWALEIWPEYDGCTSAISRNGYTIHSKTFDQFKESIQSNYNKCASKIQNKLTGELKFVDDFGVQYICIVRGNTKGYLDIWLPNSDLHIRTEEDIKWFMSELDKVEKRVKEIRELKGWGSKRDPVVRSDGSIETRGNWFNKFFGRK